MTSERLTELAEAALEAERKDAGRRALALALEMIEECDTEDYDKRYVLVFGAVYAASSIGLKAGIRFDEAEGPEWPVLYIELPTGQVSWHMPHHDEPYDGHSTNVKYQRCRDYTRDVLDNDGD